jgi:hypothetical protein
MTHSLILITSKTGKMPPRKPMTRFSPRMPKMKEPEVGEGSTPGAAREIDFVSRMESIICTSTKKEFSQPPEFRDTKASTGFKVLLLHWGDMYSKIIQEDYSKFTPHNNPDVKILDDQVFPNIKRSYMHRVACRTPVLPCIKIFVWIIDHADTVKCTIKNAEGKCVGVVITSGNSPRLYLRDAW